MRDADLIHPSGMIKGWKIRMPFDLPRPDHAGTVRSWVITGPFHPAWQWWMVTVIHLRDIPGVKPATKQYPEAEYEFMIVSLNPERGLPDVDAIERGEDWGDTSIPKFLTPADSVVQFHGLNDHQAGELCDLAAKAIVNAHVSPDQDYRRWWESAIPTTVKHVRGEPH